MMKADPILEQDILIGQYTLGLLSPQETHRVQALLGRDAAAARCALHWEEAFLPLVDALPPTEPPTHVLEQVLAALDLPFPTEPDSVPSPASGMSAEKPEPAIRRAPKPTAIHPDASRLQTSHPPQRPSHLRTENDQAAASTRPGSDLPDGHATLTQDRKRRSRRVWMGGAAGLTLVALLTLAFMPRQPAEPPIVVVEVAPSKGAILQAPGQSSTPGWVVTIDLENNVTLTPQVHTETPADVSVQLWTYSKSLRQPRSLGLIDPNQPVAIPAELMGEISEDQFFEMTLEPAGGSPTAEPTGPILFIGQVVTFS